jgi:hypothetical protein
VDRDENCVKRGEKSEVNSGMKREVKRGAKSRVKISD